MIRRSGGGSWGSRGSPTLYGQRRSGPNGGRIAVLVAGAILILAFAFFLFRMCTGTSCDKPYCPSGDSPPLLEEYTRVTKVYKYNQKQTGDVPADFQVQVQLPMEEPSTDGRNLGFFSFNETTRNWEPITPAILDPQGKTVSATLNSAPKVIAVLRRLSAGGQVVAYLGHNGVLHQDAARTVTVLHTRDFEPASDGSLSGELTDFAVTGVKTDGSVALLPTVGATTSQLTPIIAGILGSSVTRSAHVQSIVQKVNDNNLAGIDINYSELTVADRTSFTLFVRELAQALHLANKKLSLTLPAPIRNSSGRVDDGAYDWAELAKDADILQMAPYRDQSTLRRDMPAILEFLTAAVQPTNKIVFTVSPYATEKSPDGLRVLGLAEAMSIATKMSLSEGTVTTNSNVTVQAYNIDTSAGRSGITWQTATACVAFTYEQNGGRTIWLENFYSIGFKLEYISKYKLGGVAVEDATAEPLIGDIWPAIVPFVNSGQPVLLQPNPNDLKPDWKVSEGIKEGGQKGVLDWSTPAQPGTYTITLTLSDGIARFENEIQVTVQEKEKSTPTASPTASG